MRSVGVDAEVMSRDYYHIMATPEWEEAAVKGNWGDDNRPEFNTSIIGDYKRPRWFMQGTIEQTDKYLRAKNNLKRHGTGHLRATECLEKAWLDLGSKRITAPTTAFARSRSLAKRIVRKAHRVVFPEFSLLYIRQLRNWIELEKFIQKFDDCFPCRPDRLTQEELVPYSGSIGWLGSIFSNYDVVQGYGTEPILPMLASKTPYVAFEHGTLRDFIRNDNAINRLTALAYRLADHVLVSNGDCLEHAEWLGCQNISPVIHPVDVEHIVVSTRPNSSGCDDLMMPMSSCFVRCGTIGKRGYRCSLKEGFTSHSARRGRPRCSCHHALGCADQR